MTAFRLGRNTTEHYSSFEEMGRCWGCKPVTRKNKDENKVKKQQEVFCGKHKCKACGEPMTWVGGNMMVCKNEKCKGIKIEKEDKEGNKSVSYITSYDLLDDTGASIAINIFA